MRRVFKIVATLVAIQMLRNIPAMAQLLAGICAAGNFLHAKIMGVRPLEKDTLATDAEHKLIVSIRSDLTQMLDHFDGLAPTQVME